MTSIYVAAPWTHRETAAATAHALVRMGHVIAHDWWAYEANATEPQRLQDCARHDLLAVLSCDVLVLLNFEKSEGKSVEQGLALGRTPRPRLIGVGPRYSNIFQYLPSWEWVDSIDDLLTLLRPA